MTCMKCVIFFQRTAAENLGVSSLNPNSLAGKEVSVAGWGKTNNYYESKNSQLVSNKTWRTSG